MVSMAKADVAWIKGRLRSGAYKQAKLHDFVQDHVLPGALARLARYENA